MTKAENQKYISKRIVDLIQFTMITMTIIESG